jgi:hypothetical protein
MIPPLASAVPSAVDRADPLAGIGRNLFFIVGCGRSGTTLLQVMLGNHPEITLPNETGFYSLLRRRNQRTLGELETPAKFRRGYEVAMDFWRVRELELDRERVWELCQGRTPSWETLFLAILAALAERRGAVRVGEKSPGHFQYLALLSERYPEARFIHLIRDPRAVACSYFRTFGIRDIGAKCKRWQLAIAEHDRFAGPLGRRYMALRYEDLVREPERTLREVCSFLGCGFAPEMLAYHERDHLGFAKHQMHHMANTLRPVFTSSLDKWRSELARDQIALVEHVLGDEMERLGYERTGARGHFLELRYRTHLATDAWTRASRWMQGMLGHEVRGRKGS